MHSLQSIKYPTVSSISIKSGSKRGKSPRSKTLTQKSPFAKEKQILRRPKTINPEKEKSYFLDKKMNKQAILERFDQIHRLSKTQSRIFNNDELNLNLNNSIPSSNRDGTSEFQVEEDQDFFQNNERALEFLKYNRLFLNIDKNCKNLKEFKSEKIVNYLKESQIIFGIMLFFYSFQSVIDFLLHVNDLQDTKSVTGFIRFFTNIALFFLSFFGIDKLFYFFALRIIFIVVVFVFLIIGIIDYHYENDYMMRNVNLALLFCPVIFTTNLSFFNFREIIFINFAFMFALVFTIIYHNSFDLENILMTFVILIHNIIKIYFQKRFHLKAFNNLKFLSLIREEQDEKISQLLPIHVK